MQQASTHGMIIESLLLARSARPVFFADDRGLFAYRLPSLPFIAVRSEITAQQPMCNLAALHYQIDDLLPLPLMNRYFERRFARGVPKKGNCQIAADIRFRLWLLRCFQDFEKLSGLGGRLET